MWRIRDFFEDAYTYLKEWIEGVKYVAIFLLIAAVAAGVFSLLFGDAIENRKSRERIDMLRDTCREVGDLGEPKYICYE